MANKADFKFLNETSSEIAMRFLTSKEPSQKLLGLKFVYDTYQNIVSEYHDGVESTEYFSLFTDVVTEFTRAVDELGTTEIRRLWSNEFFIYIILSVAKNTKIVSKSRDKISKCKIIRKKDINQSSINEEDFLETSPDDVSPDVTTLLNFESGLGYIISRKKQREGSIDDKYWGRIYSPFTFYFSKAGNSPENNLMNNWEADALFGFSSGLLCNHLTGIIQKYYYKVFGSTYRSDDFCADEQDAFLSTYLINYIYAYKNKAVPDDVQEENLNLINTNEAANAIKSLLDYFVDYDCCPKYQRIERIGDNLRKYVYFPDDVVSEIVDTYSVTRNFYLFMVLFQVWKGADEKLIDDNLDQEIFHTFIQVQVLDSENEGADKSKITYVNDPHNIIEEFFKLLKPDASIDVDQSVEDMLLPFFSSMQRRYKENQLQEAKKANSEYSTANIRKIEQIASKKAFLNVSDRFAPLLNKSLENEGETCVNDDIVRFTCPTSYFEKESLTNTTIEYVNRWVFWEVYKYLNRHKLIETFDSDDDERNLSLLNKYDTILCPRYFLTKYRYKYPKQYSESLYNKNIIDLTGVDMMLLDSSLISVEINDVPAKMHTIKISETTAKKDKDGKYQYASVQGYPMTFSEDELAEYLAESLKSIDIGANITIKTKGEKVGVLLKHKL